MAVSLSALCAGCRVTPQKDYFSASSTHFCYRLSKIQSLVRFAYYYYYYYYYTVKLNCVQLTCQTQQI
jgi:hypothetical protein